MHGWIVAIAKHQCRLGFWCWLSYISRHQYNVVLTQYVTQLLNDSLLEFSVQPLQIISFKHSCCGLNQTISTMFTTLRLTLWRAWHSSHLAVCGLGFLLISSWRWIENDLQTSRCVLVIWSRGWLVTFLKETFRSHTSIDCQEMRGAEVMDVLQNHASYLTMHYNK